MSDRPIRVLLVDDSIFVRHVLARELSVFPDIKIVDTAADAFAAQEMIKRHQPDVVVLDVEMPRVDGLTFLRHLMSTRPLPVIILSSLAESGTRTALDALESGAFEVIAKPKGSAHSIRVVIEQLSAAIRSAPRSKLRPRAQVPVAARAAPAKSGKLLQRPSSKIIAIGASTGGTEAIKAILTQLPPDCPGILCVIHMPEVFTFQYAQRLNALCSIEVREASHGDELRTGLALIAKGDHHLSVMRSGSRHTARLTQGPPVSRHRPSVDVLFASMAEQVRGDALGVILTGMGNDGARGLLAMREAGAATIAQDESTCVVYGMPREAVEAGAAERVLPIDHIAGACMKWAKSGDGK